MLMANETFQTLSETRFSDARFAILHVLFVCLHYEKN